MPQESKTGVKSWEGSYPPMVSEIGSSGGTLSLWDIQIYYLFTYYSTKHRPEVSDVTCQHSLAELYPQPLQEPFMHLPGVNELRHSYTEVAIQMAGRNIRSHL